MCDQQRWLERRRIILLLVLCLLFVPLAVTHWTPALTPTNSRWAPILTDSLLLSISSPSRPTVMLYFHSLSFSAHAASIAWPPTLAPLSPASRPRCAHYLSAIHTHSPGRPSPAHAARPTSPHPHSSEVSKGAPAQLAAMGIAVESLVRVKRYVVTATDPPTSVSAQRPEPHSFAHEGVRRLTAKHPRM